MTGWVQIAGLLAYLAGLAEIAGLAGLLAYLADLAGLAGLSNPKSLTRGGGII